MRVRGLKPSSRIGGTNNSVDRWRQPASLLRAAATDLNYWLLLLTFGIFFALVGALRGAKWV